MKKSRKDKETAKIGNGNTAVWLSPKLKSPTLRGWLKNLAQGWDLVSDAVSVTDPKTNELLYVNSAWRQLYGYSPKEALGQPAAMLNPGGLDAKKQATIIAQSRKGGWKGRLMNQDTEGNVFAVDLTTQSLYDVEGNLQGLLGIATPVRRNNVSDEKIQQLVAQHQVILTRELHKLIETILVTDLALGTGNAKGKAKSSGKVNGKLEEILGMGRLSERELEVFTLIGRGMGTRQISQQLGVSAYTVQTHRNHIKDKLQLPDSAAITYWAFQWANGTKG